jgi:hypothetical protein
MLHGSLVLHGWWLSDAAFYTTQLPLYALMEAVLGPIPSVIHLAGAMTYTLAVLLAAIVAKGKATGREGVLRMVIAAGIMLVPQAGGGVLVLDLSLGPIGTAILLLLAWLLLDHSGAKRWVPPVIGILLAWVLTADTLVIYVGVVPVVAVYGVRAYREVIVARQRVASAWFEIAMAASALAAIPVAAAVSAVLRSLGGFAVIPDRAGLVTGSGLISNITVTFENVLTLFGANFFGIPTGFDFAAALLHLAGVALAGAGVWLGIRRFVRGSGPGGTVDEVMAVAVLASLIAFVVSTQAIDPSYAGEIAAVLPFSAALAGRMLPERLVTARILPLLSVVLAGYAFMLAQGAVQPPAKPMPTQQLASWLAARHFRYGLGGYWQASAVTLASGQHVQVRPIDVGPHNKVGAYPWESNASWYDPTLHYANFVILDPGTTSYHVDGTWVNIRATWGNPVRFYRVGSYRVLVYRKNLLAGLGCGEIYGRNTGTASLHGPRCS